MLHSETSFQDGGSRDAKEPTSDIRLDVLHRSERCLPLSWYFSRTPTIPPFHMDGKHIRVYMPTLRPDQCPTSFHKAAEACDGLPEGAGVKDNHLLGRSADNESVLRGAPITSEPDSAASGVTGLQHQLGKIPACTIPEDPIPGVSGGLRVHEAIPPRGQGAADQPDVSQPPVTAESVPQVPFSTSGKDVCYKPGSTSSATMVPQPPAAQDPVTYRVVVRQPSDPGPPAKAELTWWSTQLH